MNEKTPKKDRLNGFRLTDVSKWRIAQPMRSDRVFVLAVFLLGAVLSAFALVWSAVAVGFETDVGAVAAGALMVAILGVCGLFVATVLKQEAMEFQRECLFADRIVKAVALLGAEKTVKRQLVNSAGKMVFHTDADGTPDISQPVFVQETEPNIEVRIGGLLSLERIAQDSAAYGGGRDHVRVMEILCAYVRENAPASEAKDFPLPEWQGLMNDPSKVERKAHDEWRKARFLDRGNGNARTWAQSLPPPREDIRLAVNIIGWRGKDLPAVAIRRTSGAARDARWFLDVPRPKFPDPPDDEVPESEEIQAYLSDLRAWRGKTDDCPEGAYSPDLSNCNLQGADLSKLNLSGVKLAGARLEGANLDETRLEKADLCRASLAGAFARRVRLDGACLGEAWLEGAYLGEARLIGANLGGARLEGAILTRAQLWEAGLWATRLEKADLGEARLEKACLLWTDIEAARLTEARLESARLISVRMRGTYFTNTRLDRALLEYLRLDRTTSFRSTIFDGAAWRGTDLTEIQLSIDQVQSTFGDAGVTPPDGMTRPAHWPDWESNLLGEPDLDGELRKWRADPDSYTPPPKPSQD